MVFVINHRSNMDYVLVTYLVSTSSALSYAVGEWARVWVLQSLIRSMGAYFVRRDRSSRSIARCWRATCTWRPPRAGAGGVSRRRADPRRHAAPAEARPAQLHGVGLRSARAARHRVRAGRHQLRPRAGGPRAARRAGDAEPGEKPRFAFNPLVLAGFLRSTSRCGCAAAGIATAMPASASARRCRCGNTSTERGIDFRALAAERALRRDRAARPDADGGGRRVVPALPVSLVATAHARRRHAAVGCWSSRARVRPDRDGWSRRGAHVHIPRADQEYAVDVGLRMLLLRHLGRGRGRPLSRQPARGSAAALLRQRHRPSAARAKAGRAAAAEYQTNAEQRRGRECFPTPTARKPPTR